MTTAEAFEEIRAHHRALGEQLTQRAEAVTSAVASGRPYAAAVGGFIGYLAGEVLPHAAAEEKTIYPLAATHAGLAGMVGEMTAEHVTLSAAGSRLAALTDGGAAAGQARQIAELFSTHAAKENDVLLPALLADATVDLVALLARIHHGAGHGTGQREIALPGSPAPGGGRGQVVMGARIRVRRVYDKPSPDDGFRVLVDRVWPRGLTKQDAHLDEWAKDVAPSAELRIWYRHDPARFDEFRQRYAAELADPGKLKAVSRLRDRAASGALTLLTATRELNLSQAAILAELLTKA
ncbi:MAG TPA: DUF488 family protein [Trebonia sp.]